MKNVVRKILNIILWVIMAIMVLTVLSGLYQRFLNKDGYTGFFGLGYAVVVSGSMEPTIHVDEMILYRRIPKENYKEGDIIVYVRDRGTEEEKLITHRITDILGDTLITKGDHNMLHDPEFPFTEVVGKVFFHVPYVGKAVSAIRSPLGIAAIAVLLILMAVFGFRDKKKDTSDASGEQPEETAG